MEKKYRRSIDLYIAIFIIGIVIIIDVFRVPTFIWLYDGIKLLLALIAIVVGGWAILTPYARISENSLYLYNVVLQKKSIPIDTIGDVKLINVQNKIEIKTGTKTHVIRLKNVRKKDREALRSDLKEQVNKSK
jgi:hypothetical protein